MRSTAGSADVESLVVITRVALKLLVALMVDVNLTPILQLGSPPPLRFPSTEQGSLTPASSRVKFAASAPEIEAPTLEIFPVTLVTVTTCVAEEDPMIVGGKMIVVFGLIVKVPAQAADETSVANRVEKMTSPKRIVFMGPPES